MVGIGGGYRGRHPCLAYEGGTVVPPSLNYYHIVVVVSRKVLFGIRRRMEELLKIPKEKANKSQETNYTPDYPGRHEVGNPLK